MNIDRKSEPSLESLCNNIMHDYARGAAGSVQCGANRVLVVRGRVQNGEAGFFTPWFVVGHEYSYPLPNSAYVAVLESAKPGLVVATSSGAGKSVIFTAPVVSIYCKGVLDITITAEFSNVYTFEILAVYPHTILV